MCDLRYTDAMIDLHTLVSSGSYLAIFLVMTANGAVNFPSSQIFYLIVGYFVGTGHFNFFYAVLFGALGNTLGNIIIYTLVQKYGHSFARKIVMLDEDMFRKIHGALHDTFSRRGMWWLFVGKLTPSVKAFIPLVAGLADTKKFPTYSIFLIASCVWAGTLIYLGKLFGENVSLSSFMAVSLVVGLTILFVVYKNIAKKF